MLEHALLVESELRFEALDQQFHSRSNLFGIEKNEPLNFPLDTVTRA